jgi:hypothetical protein
MDRDSKNMKKIGHLRTIGTSSNQENFQKSFIGTEWL